MITPDNSNATLEEANTYHTDRATPGWLTASQTAREAALVRATDYIRFNYKLVCGVDRTHDLVKLATIVLAASAITASLTVDQNERDIIAKTVESSSGASIATTYSTSKTNDLYPHVTLILSEVASRRGGAITFSRMVR